MPTNKKKARADAKRSKSEGKARVADNARMDAAVARLEDQKQSAYTTYKSCTDRLKKWCVGQTKRPRISSIRDWYGALVQIRQNTSVLPRDVSADLNVAIRLRHETNQLYTNLKHSDEESHDRHHFMVSFLREWRRMFDAPISRTVSSPTVPTEGEVEGGLSTGIFDALRLDDLPGVQDEHEMFCPSSSLEEGDAPEIQEKDDRLFAVACLLQDATRIRAKIRSLWVDYAAECSTPGFDHGAAALLGATHGTTFGVKILASLASSVVVQCDDLNSLGTMIKLFACAEQDDALQAHAAASTAAHMSEVITALCNFDAPSAVVRGNSACQQDVTQLEWVTTLMESFPQQNPQDFGSILQTVMAHHLPLWTWQASHGVNLGSSDSILRTYLREFLHHKRPSFHLAFAVVAAIDCTASTQCINCVVAYNPLYPPSTNCINQASVCCISALSDDCGVGHVFAQWQHVERSEFMKVDPKSPSMPMHGDWLQQQGACISDNDPHGAPMYSISPWVSGLQLWTYGRFWSMRLGIDMLDAQMPEFMAMVHIYWALKAHKIVRKIQPLEDVIAIFQEQRLFTHGLPQPGSDQWSKSWMALSGAAPRRSQNGGFSTFVANILRITVAEISPVHDAVQQLHSHFDDPERMITELPAMVKEEVARVHNTRFAEVALKITEYFNALPRMGLPALTMAVARAGSDIAAATPNGARKVNKQKARAKKVMTDRLLAEDDSRSRVMSICSQFFALLDVSAEFAPLLQVEENREYMNTLGCYLAMVFEQQCPHRQLYFPVGCPVKVAVSPDSVTLQAAIEEQQCMLADLTAGDERHDGIVAALVRLRHTERIAGSSDEKYIIDGSGDGSRWVTGRVVSLYPHAYFPNRKFSFTALDFFVGEAANGRGYLVELDDGERVHIPCDGARAIRHSVFQPTTKQMAASIAEMAVMVARQEQVVEVARKEQLMYQTCSFQDMSTSPSEEAEQRLLFLRRDMEAMEATMKPGGAGADHCVWHTWVDNIGGIGVGDDVYCGDSRWFEGEPAPLQFSGHSERPRAGMGISSFSKCFTQAHEIESFKKGQARLQQQRDS
jgi:hypothetical protein